MSLTAANQARLEKSFNQVYSFNGEILTLKAKLDRDAVSFESKETPKYEYNRTKFNRMDNREQEAYEKKLQEKKISYRAIYADGAFIEIPKIVFEHYTLEGGK